MTLMFEQQETLRFYLARVESVSANGDVRFGAPIGLQHRFPDKNTTWLRLHPGASPDRLLAVQRVDAPGVYLARVAIQAPDEAVGHGREFSASAYFSVEASVHDYPTTQASVVDTKEHGP